MKTNKKSEINLPSAWQHWIGFITLIAISLAFILYLTSVIISSKQVLAKSIEINERIELNEAEKVHTDLTRTLEVLQEPKETEVWFTNFGEWENEDITASGLTTKHFTVNDDHMYEYNGYVVLATANTTRFNKPLYSDYKSYNLNDIVIFKLNEKVYSGIVLDVCGACYGVSNEDLQRYDIMTTKDYVGKTKGIVYD